MLKLYRNSTIMNIYVSVYPETHKPNGVGGPGLPPLPPFKSLATGTQPVLCRPPLLQHRRISHLPFLLIYSILIFATISVAVSSYIYIYIFIMLKRITLNKVFLNKGNILQKVWE